MKKETVLIYVIILLLALPIFVCANVEKISKNIIDSTNDQKIRVVIHFKDIPSYTQKNIMSTSTAIISSEKINYQNNNSVFASLTKKEIEQLALSNSIEHITQEKTYHTLLQDSVPLINATVSWNLQMNGINLTGEDQTICIIDTGVNYSHPDLGGCFGENNVSSTCKIIGGWNTYWNNNTILDDYGHGTHVAGIAAANGTVTGVAPFSKIVMIKANIPTSNSFNGADIIEGIDWCVNNAETFNISVISMSLGGDTYYTGYCDNSPGEHSDRDAINRATAKNISVVVASGNEYNKTSISSPACIQNATPVTSSDGADTNISSFANIWNNTLLKILAAPGENIYSTYEEGYAYANGTSMSTPHVAGAIAIIKQYLNLSGRTRTPSEIEDLLNATGKQIYDYEAGRSFSRIDVYSALMEIDSTSPNVTLSTPQNNSLSSNINQSFICNTSDWQLENVTFYLWNSTDLYNNETKNITGIVNSTSFNKTEMAPGNYKWNCLAYDVKGNSNFSASNFSITIGGISLSIIEPANNTYTNINETYFNCSAATSQDRQMKNMTFYIFENNILANYSTINLTGTTNSSLFSFNFTNETNYTWTCEVYSNASDYDIKNYTITYDITYPNITFAEEVVTTSQATLSWNTSEVTNYSFTLNGADYANSSFYLNYSLTISGLVASTTYNYNLTYCDEAGNCNSTEESFTTNTNPVVTSSSGGGGGGGGSTPIKLTETQILQGYNKKYSLGEKVSFSYGGQNHSLQLNKIINNSVNITIRSEPINLIMKNGEEKKINLSSSEYYNLYIKIENLTKYNANITIRGIEELINPIMKYNNETNLTDKGKEYEIFNNNPEKIEKNIWNLYVVLILIVIVLIFIRIIFIRLKKGKAKKRKKSKFLY